MYQVVNEFLKPQNKCEHFNGLCLFICLLLLNNMDSIHILGIYFLCFQRGNQCPIAVFAELETNIAQVIAFLSFASRVSTTGQ